MTPEGVRAAVVEDLRSQRAFAEGTRFVSDSLELARFVSCHVVASVRRCALTDSVPVVLVHVSMRRADSAEVLVGRYRMFYSRCPSGTRIDPPVIAIDANETRTVVYRDGAWVETGFRTRVVC
jgi:hypothetical protein